MTRPAYLISHTHWDREWYRTFQQFRLDLVRTVDLVLDTLRDDPGFAHFLLDGQTIIIDDYLAMRPEREDELQGQIASGRLAVGPWYCHPDLFLVSGESIVRNLMMGVRMARARGRLLAVGYLPDQFGHTGQLPQILQSFGIDAAVLWRGVNTRETPNESWWEAPDGSRVFLAVLAQSYSNAQALPLDPGNLADRLRQLCELLARGASGPGVLLMNGGDHVPIQPGLPTALVGANRLLASDWEVEQTDLEAAVRALRISGRPELVLRGELRSSATSHLLPGVLSARIPLKQRNVLAQLLLEREAEPYAAWASLLGAGYPLGELWEAWRQLLQCQPHDSICGCSIDQVHREMGIRYDAVEQIGEELIGRSLGFVASRVDTRLPAGAPSHTVPLVVVNPGAGPRTERVRLSLQLPGVAEGYQVVDARGRNVPHRWLGEGGEPSTVMPVPRENIPSVNVVMAQFEGNRVMGMGVQKVTTRVADDSVHVEVTVGSSGIMTREEIEHHFRDVAALIAATGPAPVTAHIHRNARLDLELLARDVPAYGFTTLWLRPIDDETLSAPDAGAEPAPESPRTRDTVENEFFLVRVDGATGALTVTDRRNNMAFGPCNVFVDSGDAGDSYTFAPPARDAVISRPVSVPEVEVVNDELGAGIRVTQEFAVPASLNDDRSARSDRTVPMRITSVITLTHGCPRVDIRTTVVNSAEDHRLRVQLAAPFRCDHVHAEAAFEVVRRSLGTLAMDGAALEDPVPDAPQHGFVALDDHGHGFLVASVGLPEYEAVPADGGGTTLALTLLRCVGWLSRDDLPTRRGGAGPTLPVPDAQCKGTHTFRYSLIPYVGDWRAAVDEAHRAQVDVRALPVTPAAGDLPAHGSFMRVDAPGVLVSAVKGAEDGRGIIVRLYNPGGADARGALHLFFPVRRVERLSLDERHIMTVYDGDPIGEIPLALDSFEIETLRLCR